MVVNMDGKSQDFTLDDLKALPASEGLAGMMSSTGKITPLTSFSGVLLTDVLEAAGGGVTKIIVHAPQAGAAGETEPTPKSEALAPAVEPPPVSERAVLPEGKNLMISGMVGEEAAWSLEELRAMTVIKATVEHPKKGNQDVEGVALNDLINAARLKLGAKTVVFTPAMVFPPRLTWKPCASAPPAWRISTNPAGSSWSCPAWTAAYG